MAIQHRTRRREGARDGTYGYEGERPTPDEAFLEPAAGPARYDWRDDVIGASGLNVLAGIWLIISPFVLGYSGADATWNPIVFGAIVAVFAAARAAGAYRAAWLSWLNMAIGVWLFISAFWLAQTARASWNVGIMGIVVFILGALSAGATPYAAARTRRNTRIG
jgi:hypothetical protein